MTQASVADWFTAVGTLAVAVVAVWGDWLKAKLLPPRATIEPQNLRGTVTQFANNRPVVFYHLKVTNQRRYPLLRQCRVLLVGLSRRGPDGQFRPEAMPIPFQLAWAPSEGMPALATVQKEQPFDMGFLLSPTSAEPGRFQPALYHVPYDFRGLVSGGDAVRYTLRVEADGMGEAPPRVVEVAWDGQWTSDLDQLAHHLTVKLLAA